MTTSLSTILDVLVIDDEPEIKLNLRALLEDAGFSVLWCTNWNNTKSLLKDREKNNKQPPDVILLDMFFQEEFCDCGDIPAMEGILMIQRIRRFYEQQFALIPNIIGYTSKLSYLQPEVIIEYGAHDFITEEEYHRPNYFANRLIRSVFEMKYENSMQPITKHRIKNIEEVIVSNALDKSSNDPSQAAKLLMWPISEVLSVAKRLKIKESYYDG